MYKTLVRENLKAYAVKCPANVKIIEKLINHLTAVVPGFPDAACPETTMTVASMLPGVIPMTGFVERSDGQMYNHYWLFDTNHKCHLDLTYSQFSDVTKRLGFRHGEALVPFLVVHANQTGVMESLGYSLANITQFTQTYASGIYKNYGNFNSNSFRYYKDKRLVSYGDDLRKDPYMRYLLSKLPKRC